MVPHSPGFPGSWAYRVKSREVYKLSSTGDDKSGTVPTGMDDSNCFMPGAAVDLKTNLVND